MCNKKMEEVKTITARKVLIKKWKENESPEREIDTSFIEEVVSHNWPVNSPHSKNSKSKITNQCRTYTWDFF